MTIYELFTKLRSSEYNISYLTGQGEDPWQELLAFNPCDKYTYTRESGQNLKIEELERFIKKNQKLGHIITGYFSYDMGYEIHRIKQTAKNDLKLPDIYLLAYDNYITLGKEGIDIKCTDPDYTKKIEAIKSRTANPPTKPSEDKNFKTVTSKEKYKENYEKIKSYITAGDIYQINLTHRMEGETTTPPRELFTKILKSNPVEYLAYLEGDDFEILSASPEKFVKIEKRKIETRPIKGTVPRGKNKEEELEYQAKLLSSTKEAAELNMITDLLRNDLGKIAKIGSVKVESTRALLKCPTVWHTYSKITATIDDKYSNLEALISMLPGGSITGCPKKRAMEIIDELETTTRGVYTGIIGYIDSKNTYEFNIAIRTIIKKEKKLYLQVGGGIVIDSKHKDEFQETLNKASSFMKILE